MKIYVEGGGDSKMLKIACRQGFSEFLKKAGLGGHMPRIVACGGRRDAYNAFCTAMEQREPAILLVDSESAVVRSFREEQAKNWNPWRHLQNRQCDQLQKPAQSNDNDCHLMVQCMESWFLADRDTLASFFGQGFQAKQLPPIANHIESISKERLFESLANATRHCKSKQPYHKGDHSFKLLALIKPDNVIGSCPWAERFVDEAKVRMGVKGPVHGD